MNIPDAESSFAAGAYSAAVERGFSDEEARALAIGLCKAASARIVDWDDGEVEEDRGEKKQRTWWGDNKGWALPTGVGLIALLAGNAAGRYGRPDRNVLQNLPKGIWETVKSLLKIPKGALRDSVTKGKVVDAPKVPSGMEGIESERTVSS